VNTQLHLPPAQLFVGPSATTKAHALEILKKTFCPQGCSLCTVCLQLEHHQHHATLWLEPENQYTLETIEPITHTIAFALAPHEHYFFIIQKADLLTAACANSLLKVVEEPPAGYHFLFLTERAQLILPTIRSRCTITTLYRATETLRSSDLVETFKTKLTCSPSAFLSLLTHEDRGEVYVQECLDELLTHWATAKKEALAQGQIDHASYSSGMIKIIKEGFHVPLMPGGSKLFWKNFYLNVKRLSP
jgi:hypothetical protein